MIIYGVDVRCHYDNGNVRVAHRYIIPESSEIFACKKKQTFDEYKYISHVTP